MEWTLADFFQDRIVFEAFGVAEIDRLDGAPGGPVIPFASHLAADCYGCIGKVLKMKIGPNFCRRGGA